jgi:hypothetical protein
MKEVRRQYGEYLRLRKAGADISLASDATLPQAKPLFYADAHLLVDKVREAYGGFRQTAPPYGLVTPQGEPITSLKGMSGLALERAMTATARRAFEIVAPPVASCPYSGALTNLGEFPLSPEQPLSEDVERFRRMTAPGALFAPATIVNMLLRMPRLAKLNHATVGLEGLARSSARPLLEEPLHHPQQYAKAFTFTIADGKRGSDFVMDRDNFMPDEVIEAYTTLGEDKAGREAIVWSRLTTDFVLRTRVRVNNRLEGSEREIEGDHITVYPIGTRLGDIAVHEPTIGCPGSQLAYDMWEQATDVMVNEGFWPQAA